MTSINASYPVLMSPVARGCGPGCGCANCKSPATNVAAGTAESARAASPSAPTSPSSPSASASASASASQASGKAAEPARASGELDPAEIAKLRELQAVDRKVRAHEAAHAAVAGNLGGPKSFSYATGPDGVQYAVGGEVAISFGSSSDPEVTLENAARVRAAALAPADPSPQDLRVAARAQQLMLQAQLDLSRERLEAAGTSSDTASPATADNPNIKAFRNVADAVTARPPQLDLRA